MLLSNTAPLPSSDFEIAISCLNCLITLIWFVSLYIQESYMLIRLQASPRKALLIFDFEWLLQITEAELNFCKIRGLSHLNRSSFGSVKPTSVLEEGSQAHYKLVTKTHQEIE